MPLMVLKCLKIKKVDNLKDIATLYPEAVQGITLGKTELNLCLKLSESALRLELQEAVQKLMHVKY